MITSANPGGADSGPPRMPSWSPGSNSSGSALQVDQPPV
jgi:hypothetical protein